MADSGTAESAREIVVTRAMMVTVAGMTFVPLAALSIYLLFLWPQPTGAPPEMQLIPSVISLALGVPFLRRLVPGGAMMITKVTVYAAYFVVGLGVMYFLSKWLICTGRGVCL